MPKFPEPPGIDTLKAIPPKIIQLSSGDLVSHIYFAGGSHPTAWNAFRYFGPTASRFDHHLPDKDCHSLSQERGILYLTTGQEAIPTALTEVFQNSRIIDRHSKGPILTAFHLQRDLQLLDLSGTFATVLGASTAIHSVPRARRWAQLLYLAYPFIDGIYYCSSMMPMSQWSPSLNAHIMPYPIDHFSSRTKRPCIAKYHDANCRKDSLRISLKDDMVKTRDRPRLIPITPPSITLVSVVCPLLRLLRTSARCLLLEANTP